MQYILVKDVIVIYEMHEQFLFDFIVWTLFFVY